MIERDPAGAASTEYQLIIVGGGVYGVTLALEAARRGLRPLLLEREDFGHATSWNSLRIVHGGLRYLQKLDLPRHRESVAERSWLLREFPDLVRPLACLMPLYGDGIRRPVVFRVALAADHLLSRGRNRRLRADRRIPKGRVLGVDATVRRFPDAERRNLVGGALWYDAAMPDSHRILIEMLHWATACGARALNYVEAVELKTRRGRVAGVEARDVASGIELDFAAPVVVNCAGPWCREVAGRFDRDLPELFFPSLAFNLLLDRPPPSEAALGISRRAPGAQTCFLVPWKERLLAGTWHAALPGGERADAVPPGLVTSFLDELDAAVPGLELGTAKVLRVFWGHLPVAVPGTTALAVRERIVDHAVHGGPQGLLTVSGVKFTTARRVAERTLWRVLSGLRQDARPRMSSQARPLPGHIPGSAELESTLRRDPEKVRRLVRRLVAEEAVVRPDDLFLRRTDWGVGLPTSHSLVADLSAVLGWSAPRGETA